MAHPRTRYYSTHILTPRSHAPGGMAGAAFKETVIGNRDYSVGYVTGEEADMLIGRTVKSGRTVQAEAYGALCLRYLRGDLSGRRGRMIVLNPVVHPKKITARRSTSVTPHPHRRRGRTPGTRPRRAARR